MLLFLDTAELSEIEKFAFMLHGVTTTPTIIKRAGMSSDQFVSIVRKKFPQLEVHIEALAKDSEATVSLIEEFSQKSWYDPEKIVFKVPICIEGLKATKQLHSLYPEVKVNLHMAFSPAQASLAMLAEPAYIAPLIGRYADKIAELAFHGKRSQGNDLGRDMLGQIMICKHAAGSQALILASSTRTVHDFVNAAALGADAVTLPPAVLEASLEHPMTKDGVDAFWKDLG